MKVAAWTSSSAVLSDCRRYRYQLWRRWEEGAGTVAFVGLNPSTADETEDDPTIRRCVAFAKRWGFRELLMLNLFAYRATDPGEMRAQADPVGPENDAHLASASGRAQLIIAAWGTGGAHLARSAAVRAALPELHVLRLNSGGEPAHPLYLPGNLTPTPWAPAPPDRSVDG